MAVVTRQQAPEDVRAAICSARYGAVREATDTFHQAWYNSTHTWGMTYWLGIPVLKNPLDLWMYQEIITALKPALVIETGTAFGGSAVYCAQMMDLSYPAGMVGKVVTIDNSPAAPCPKHPRIVPLVGDSLSGEIRAKVCGYFAEVPHGRHVVVLLDSDHSEAHVRQELEAYHDFVTQGSYLIVEDTNVNGHPVLSSHGPGPFEAVQDFLATHDEFTPDPFCEKFLLTMQPGGYLRRAA